MNAYTRRTFLRHTAASLAAVVAPGLAMADNYPSRPIKLICPWTVGGPTDVILRVFAERVGKTLGRPMIVENKPGVSGSLGALELASAKPDGYTIAQLPIGIFRVPHMQKVAFDPLKDITYIAALSGYVMGLVVRSDSPIKTVKDLVDFAKANPGTFTYSSLGTGSTPHLVMEQFSRRAGIKLLHVPYKGSAEGLQAILGGHVMAHSDTTGWGPSVDAGRLRLLAVYGSKRAKRWPNAPTLTELGYATVSESPFGIGAPKGLDPAITKRLHDAFKQALFDPVTVSTLDKYDQSVYYLDSEAYTKLAHQTYKEERELLESLGLAKPNP